MSNYKGIKTLEVLEGADNYNKWIASRIKKYLKSPVLELGAGTGNISSYFTNIKDLSISDVDPILINQLRRKFKKHNNISITFLDVENVNKFDKKFKSIYSVNVLEHIKDDLKALRNINSLLLKDGKFIALVPAKKAAFSRLDKKLGHYRRYEKEELRKKMTDAGFEVEFLEYFNVTGLLSWIVRDKITKDHNQLKKSHVKAFDWIVPIISRIEPKHNLPFGISLIVVGKKI